MPYCPRCGVETDYDVTPCPLCDFPIPPVPRDDPMDRMELTGYRNYYEMLRSEKKRKARRVRSITFLIMAGVSLYTAFQVGMQDLMINRKVTFSPYVMSSLILFVVFLYVIFGYVRKGRRILFLLFPAVSLYLLSLDLFSGQINWFWDLGLPLTALFFAWLALDAAVIRSRKIGWQYSTGIILTGTGLFCFLLELIVDRRLGLIEPAWSLTVFLFALPLAVSFVLFKLILPGRFVDKLKRYFHI